MASEVESEADDSLTTLVCGFLPVLEILVMRHLTSGWEVVSGPAHPMLVHDLFADPIRLPVQDRDEAARDVYLVVNMRTRAAVDGFEPWAESIVEPGKHLQGNWLASIQEKEESARNSGPEMP